MEIVMEEHEILAEVMNRHERLCEIANQRLKLIGLNIAEVMADLKESPNDYKLQFENCRLLQDLTIDINDVVAFFHAELINKK